MNISLQKLLLKMEEELRLAKGAETEAAIREKIHAIKTLCELLLDNPVQQSPDRGVTNTSDRVQVQSPPSQTAFQQQMPGTQQPAPLMPQPKKLKMDDEANGDSLFDF